MSTTIDPSLQRKLDALLDQVGPLRVRHCPLTPTPRQEAFLRLTCREALFGGAAGGGKSVALVMDAGQYVDVPGYHALLLRPTLGELEQPGGLLELAHTWYGLTKATWSGELRAWRFPGPGPKRRRRQLDPLRLLRRTAGCQPLQRQQLLLPRLRRTLTGRGAQLPPHATGSTPTR